MMLPNFAERRQARQDRRPPFLSVVPGLIGAGLVFAAVDHWSGTGLFSAFRAALTNCQIKGNIGSKPAERTYYLPDDPRYGVIRIDAGSGERWFCSEAEARGAGWHRP